MPLLASPDEAGPAGRDPGPMLEEKPGFDRRRCWNVGKGFKPFLACTIGYRRPPSALLQATSHRLIFCLPLGGGGRRPEGGGWSGGGRWGMEARGMRLRPGCTGRYVTGFPRATNHRPQATGCFFDSPDEAARPPGSGAHAGREAGVRSPRALERRGGLQALSCSTVGYRRRPNAFLQATNHKPRGTGYRLIFCLPLGGGGRRPEGGGWSGGGRWDLVCGR